MFAHGLLTHVHVETRKHEQWLNRKANNETSLGRSLAAHSGRTVPEFHRSSLFTDSAETKSVTSDVGDSIYEPLAVNAFLNALDSPAKRVV
ncbi:hypothetical protein RBSH_00989 [Rhodopirellula baltica SH28]|uniref:Uncharacterized protein n=2 Tax=Rhodopirellula baltica TaxID=265606 RepID=Q7USD4_RHOBA|nr:hypothetical protein RBSH_00989 [Rhodopirellula baltica SH28]CAD73863.1 hypothetical protein RB4572 [Rhodopirellula baltica SH 1]